MPRLLAAGLALLAVAGCGTARTELTAPAQRTGGQAVVTPLHLSTLAFEPNVGRAGPAIDYLAHGQGFTLALTRGGPIIGAGSGPPVRTQLIGAHPARAQRSGRLHTVVNSYIGSDRRNWHTGIPTFGRVSYRHAWPGIDVAYHGRNGELEYDFLLRPGADPGRIAWRFDGARAVYVDSRGDLVVQSAGGRLRQPRPHAWQQGPRGREPVDAGFVVRGVTVRLRVGAYDLRRALTIDPQLVYSTYLGGTYTTPGGIAVDSNGAMYVSGFVGDPSTWPGVSSPTSLGTGTANEGFVAKIKPDGTALDYLTLFGGSSPNGTYSQPFTVAVDADGNAYTTGYTNATDFPTTSAAVQKDALGGQIDVFAVKLDTTGARVYATYIGGDGTDAAAYGGTAVTSDGKLIVGGYSDSSTLPTTTGALQTTNPKSGSTHGFIAELSADGTSYSYFTWFGSTTGTDYLNGLAQGSDGKIYVTGVLDQGKVPGVADVDAVAAKASAGNYVYVAKLTLAASTAPTWSKIKGGTGDDEAGAITVDSGGLASITGYTTSNDFPTVGALQVANSTEVFVLKLKSDGTDDWGKTFGGLVNVQVLATAIAADAEGNLYVVGAEGADWPLHNNSGIQSGSAGGTEEAFIMKLRHDGPVQIYSSYLGSSNYDAAFGVAADSHGAAYITGVTANNDFNTVNPMQGYVSDVTQHQNQGFVSKIVPYLPQIDSASPHDGVATMQTSASFTFSDPDAEISFKCFLDRGTGSEQAGSCGNSKSYAGPLPDGAHTFEVQATDAGGTTDGRYAAIHWIVDTHPPGAFTVTDPADGATVPPQPDFKWNAAPDLASGVAKYQVLVDGQQVAETTTCCHVAPGAAIADGAHTWTVRAVDRVGLSTESNPRSMTVVSPLTAKLVVSPNPALVGGTITFDGSGSATATHAIAKYEWDLDGDGTFERDTGATATTTKVFNTAGTVNVGLRVTDTVGQTATATVPLKLNNPPSLGKQFGVSINHGAQFTRTPDVVVDANFPTGITSMIFSNDGGFFTPATFPPQAKTKWKLDSSGPERLPKTIYVRFLTGIIPSQTFQDDIILDEIPPVVQKAAITPLGAPTGAAVAAAAGRKWKVKVKATDSNSGVGGLQVTANKRKPGKVLRYKKTLTVKAATRPKFVRARDRAGNFSPWKKAR